VTGPCGEVNVSEVLLKPRLAAGGVTMCVTPMSNGAGLAAAKITLASGWAPTGKLVGLTLTVIVPGKVALVRVHGEPGGVGGGSLGETAEADLHRTVSGAGKAVEPS
jgi:hypothetical protein